MVDEQIRCELALDRTYELVRAYQYDLHVQFVNCTTGEQIASFVRAWGPLSFSVDELKRQSCSAPLSGYLIFQRWLKGFVGLLTAFKTSVGEREALQEFVKAEGDEWRSSAIASGQSESLLLLGLKNQFRIEGEISAWLNKSTLSTVRSAIQFVVDVMPVGGGPRLMCVRRSTKPAVEAAWKVDSLEEALKWMVWYDEFTQHPLICCQACRKIFRPETAHPRKFCTYKCAHRVAAREWQRKQNKSRRSSNGTRKTR